MCQSIAKSVIVARGLPSRLEFGSRVHLPFNCLVTTTTEKKEKRRKRKKNSQSRKRKKNMMKFADIVSDPLFRLDVSSAAAAARDSLRGKCMMGFLRFV